jgi:hypothetical protein
MLRASQPIIMKGFATTKTTKDLLIACKGKIGKGPEYKDKRVIYGFDLQTKTLTSEPVFDFDLQVIKDFAINKKLIFQQRRVKRKGNRHTEPFIKFRTSAIGIHPVTKKLFLLSASDYLLFIFNMNGDIEHIEQLNPTIFNKAEGITFYENGDMLITNEGQDKKPTLLFLNTDKIKTTAKSKLPASVKRQRHNDYEPTLDTNNYSNDT